MQYIQLTYTEQKHEHIHKSTQMQQKLNAMHKTNNNQHFERETNISNLYWTLKI